MAVWGGRGARRWSKKGEGRGGGLERERGEVAVWGGRGVRWRSGKGEG